MWDNILFDLDGTLTDSAPGILASVRHALVNMGAEVPGDDVLQKFLGPPLDDSFERYCGFSRTEAETAVKIYRERFSTVGLYENAVYPGVPQLLDGLKAAGRRLFVATSKPEVYAVRILEHFGLAEAFEKIAGPSLALSGFGKAGVIRAVMDGAALRPESTVMVGDREHDVLGAKENGIPCIGVLYGYGPRAELVAAGAAFIAEDVPALGRRLQQFQ